MFVNLSAIRGTARRREWKLVATTSSRVHGVPKLVTRETHRETTLFEIPLTSGEVLHLSGGKAMPRTRLRRCS